MLRGGYWDANSPRKPATKRVEKASSPVATGSLGLSPLAQWLTPAKPPEGERADTGETRGKVGKPEDSVSPTVWSKRAFPPTDENTAKVEDASLGGSVGSRPSLPFGPMMGAGSSDKFASTLDTSRLKMPRLGRSEKSTMKGAKEAEALEAISRMESIAKFLLSAQVELRVFELLPTEEVAKWKGFRELVSPRKPGTMMRHCRMFKRFETFLMADSPSDTPLTRSGEGVLDRRAVKRWFDDLKDAASGAGTLQAALGMFYAFGELLEFDQEISSCKPLRKIADDWKINKAKEPLRAQAYSPRLIGWLERMVNNEALPVADRALCGRMRVSVGASIRNDDMKRTPIGRCEWILSPEGKKRALRTRAAETKTFPRHWTCSCLSASGKEEGWLETTMNLLEEAHGPTLLTDDHFGKLSNQSRTGWERTPPDGSSDAAHLRFLMRKETAFFDGAAGFTLEETRATRVHGAKPTMVSIGMHLGISEIAVRHQGGWKGKSESTMPDTYLRESQILALELQEKCLLHLRKGGEDGRIRTARVFEGQEPKLSDLVLPLIHI